MRKIGITWLGTMWWWVEGDNIDLGIRNVNLCRSQVKKMEKIGFDRSKMCNDFTQTAHRIYSTVLPL